MELELEKIRSFVAVAAEGSLARAAPQLFVSTSGLSRRIHDLEKELGVLLIERSTHGVMLTPAGQQVLVHANKILAACDELYATARAQAAGPSQLRTIQVGMAPAVESTIRHLVMTAARDSNDDVAVSLVPDANTHLIHRLLVGDLDMAILHQQPLSPEVESIQVLSEKMLISLAPHLPQARKENLTLRDLVDLPFITSSTLIGGTPVFYAKFRSILEEAGITRVIDVGPIDMFAIREHVLGGSGFALTVEGSSHWFEGAISRRVADLDMSMDTWVAWGRRAERDPVLWQAIQAVRHMFEQDITAAVEKLSVAEDDPADALVGTKGF